MDFVIEKKAVVKVKIYDRELDIKKPTVGMIESLNAQMKAVVDDGEKFKIMRSFLVQLGLPEEVLNEMQMDHYLELVEFLSAPKKK